MKQIDIEEYLNDRVLAHIDYCDDVAYSYRSKYYLIEWVLIIVASLTPIFVILNFSFARDNWAQWIPVASSTVVAILTGGLKTFRYEENWKKYSELAELLKKEKYQFMTGSGIYQSSDTPETLFIEAVETILGKI
jgi:DNA-binding XRE family transcriptional regulator